MAAVDCCLWKRAWPLDSDSIEIFTFYNFNLCLMETKAGAFSGSLCMLILDKPVLFDKRVALLSLLWDQLQFMHYV